MRTVLIVVFQVVIAWLVAGALMPPILMAMPATRGPRVGMTLTVLMLTAVFLLLRAVWPKPRRD